MVQLHQDIWIQWVCHNSTPGTAACFQVVTSLEPEHLFSFALETEDMTPEDFCGQHRVHQGATYTEASELLGGLTLTGDVTAMGAGPKVC